MCFYVTAFLMASIKHVCQLVHSNIDHFQLGLRLHRTRSGLLYLPHWHKETQYALLQSEERSHVNFALHIGARKQNMSWTPIILVILITDFRFVCKRGSIQLESQICWSFLVRWLINTKRWMLQNVYISQPYAAENNTQFSYLAISVRDR